jgi:hypothetical protein
MAYPRVGHSIYFSSTWLLTWKLMEWNRPSTNVTVELLGICHWSQRELLLQIEAVYREIANYYKLIWKEQPGFPAIRLYGESALKKKWFSFIILLIFHTFSKEIISILIKISDIECIAILLRILEVSCWNLRAETGCPGWGFSWFQPLKLCHECLIPRSF